MSSKSATAWLDYADKMLVLLRSLEPERAPADSLDAFQALVEQWRPLASSPGDFHWVSERPSSEVGYMLNALYEAGLAIEESHDAGTAELRPEAADEFHYAVVNQCLACLEAEGGPDAQLVDILREHWGVAGS